MSCKINLVIQPSLDRIFRTQNRRGRKYESMPQNKSFPTVLRVLVT